MLNMLTRKDQLEHMEKVEYKSPNFSKVRFFLQKIKVRTFSGLEFFDFFAPHPSFIVNEQYSHEFHSLSI